MGIFLRDVDGLFVMSMAYLLEIINKKGTAD